MDEVKIVYKGVLVSELAHYSGDERAYALERCYEASYRRYCEELVSREGVAAVLGRTAADRAPWGLDPTVCERIEQEVATLAMQLDEADWSDEFVEEVVAQQALDQVREEVDS